MVFYAGRLVLQPEMQNPTIVVITDRNDLDGQLFRHILSLSRSSAPDPRAGSRSRRPEARLAVSSGHVVFTTIQKFMPLAGEHYPELRIDGTSCNR